MRLTGVHAQERKHRANDNFWAQASNRQQVFYRDHLNSEHSVSEKNVAQHRHAIYFQPSRPIESIKPSLWSSVKRVPIRLAQRLSPKPARITMNPGAENDDITAKARKHGIAVWKVAR
jgi:hypothetical protein